jgi:hypothetical protein
MHLFFRIPCKCANCFLRGTSVDYLTAGVENKFFGEELPIDAPQFMGTLPKRAEKIRLDELKKMNDLAKSFMDKAV